MRLLIERLIDSGVDPIEAAEIITRAAIVGAQSEPRSSGAIRQERYRRNKASQTVTRDDDVAPNKESSPTPPKEINPLGSITPRKPPKAKRHVNGHDAETYSEFEENVWADFPRHPNSRKDPAFKAYERLPMESRANCIRGVLRYAQRFRAEEDPKRSEAERLRYVPHLVTWITQKGWEVELERTH